MPERTILRVIHEGINFYPKSHVPPTVTYGRRKPFEEFKTGSKYRDYRLSR